MKRKSEVIDENSVKKRKSNFDIRKFIGYLNGSQPNFVDLLGGFLEAIETGDEVLESYIK